MPTPSKPAKVIELEKKSHRTKRELNQRKQEEKALLTGKRIKEAEEVKESKIAHKEFLRLEKLMSEIEKNDDLYGSILNRYCLVKAECAEFEKRKEKIYEDMNELQGHKERFNEFDELKEYYKIIDSMQKSVIAIDRQVQTKRRMLMDIEKENVMTIASALRSIPKKPESTKSALMDALSG